MWDAVGMLTTVGALLLTLKLLCLQSVEVLARLTLPLKAKSLQMYATKLQSKLRKFFNKLKTTPTPIKTVHMA